MRPSLQHIILTGPPRSGTTLACHLLNQAPNTVALHEPMRLQMFPDADRALKNIDVFFGEMRTSLLQDGTAIARVKSGEIPDNPFGDAQGGIRYSSVTKAKVHFDKALDEDFRLVMKHNGHFTFLLAALVKRYPCYAIIRNPLATIASWNTISAPVAQGNLKVLRFLRPSLYKALEEIPNLFDRQIRLLGEMYECFELLPESHIISYEKMIATQGKALAVISPYAQSLESSLSSKNQNPLYRNLPLQEIADRLLAEEGKWHAYYSPEEILQCCSNP